MKKIIIALSLCLALLLGLCVALEVKNSQPTQTGPEPCTVSFTVLGTTVSRQTVTAGQSPESFAPAFYGVRITGWVDENGQALDPFSTPVTADTGYTAVAYPELTAHVPYLLPDSSGLLLPDSPLTGDALSEALHALAAPGAADFFPALPAGSEPVAQEQLVEILGSFFDADAVAAAFPQDLTLTRAAFAQGMHSLLGLSEDECVVLGEDAVIPADVTMERGDALYLLEASVAHTPDSAGVAWTEVELPSGQEPGFVLTDGWLYYVQENGYLLRDGSLGDLYFGADGRYTCGDAVLDQTVATLLNEFILENPEATRFELLRVAFDYCHQTFGYRRSWDDHPAKGSHGWEIQRAKDIFESGKGNCYGFAAAFWALARGLGYEARAISGVVLSDEQPHSWCFIEFDGLDYIFDPQWQFDYTRREIYEYDMFYLPSNDIYYWGYQWFE